MRQGPERKRGEEDSGRLRKEDSDKGRRGERKRKQDKPGSGEERNQERVIDVMLKGEGR